MKKQYGDHLQLNKYVTASRKKGKREGHHLSTQKLSHRAMYNIESIEKGMQQRELKRRHTLLMLDF